MFFKKSKLFNRHRIVAKIRCSINAWLFRHSKGIIFNEFCHIDHLFKFNFFMLETIFFCINFSSIYHVPCQVYYFLNTSQNTQYQNMTQKDGCKNNNQTKIQNKLHKEICGKSTWHGSFSRLAALRPLLRNNKTLIFRCGPGECACRISGLYSFSFAQEEWHTYTNK